MIIYPFKTLQDIVGNRTVRVFISSTFKDMREERDALARYVFPAVRLLCDERFVTLVDIDLRWGIEEQEAIENRILETCLREIDHCRPFFIGLLGERYGEAPDGNESFTEHEIRHGVLDNPSQASCALFFFRDSEYAGRKGDFVESAPDRIKKLESLKAHIKQAGCGVIKDYPNPAVFGQLVQDELTGLIDKLFPAVSVPDPFERERLAHEWFVTKSSEQIVGRTEDLAKLNNHVEGDGPPIALVGEPGIGKSTLLGAWIKAHRASHPETLVFAHFVGATLDSTDWKHMLKRILMALDDLDEEIAIRLDYPRKLPDRPDALISAFWHALLAKSQTRIVLVIDGLDNLNDRDQALDLAWLPKNIGQWVRVILSVSGGRPLEEVERRGWDRHTLALINPEERGEMIDKFSNMYGKTRASDTIATIKQDICFNTPPEQAGQPQFIQAILDELRLMPNDQAVKDTFEECLKHPTTKDLYKEQIFHRYEKDCERKLVAETLELLWATRGGITENELLQLLGNPVKAVWSPLYVALAPALLNLSGPIRIASKAMMKAIHERYIKSAGTEHAAGVHLRLAEHFAVRKAGASEADPRQVNELLWHLFKAEEWRRLADVLSDPFFFKTAWAVDSSEVSCLWSEVLQHVHLTLIDAYRPMLERPELYETCLGELAELLMEKQYPQDALHILDAVISLRSRDGDNSGLFTAWSEKGSILGELGRFQEALEAHRNAEQIARQLDQPLWLQACLCNEACVLLELGEIDAAKDASIEQERICRRYVETKGLAAALGNLGLVHQLRGKSSEALDYYDRQATLCKEIGDSIGLSNAIGNAANVLHGQKRSNEANSLFKQQESICRQTKNFRGLASSLYGQALAAQSSGNVDSALAYLEKSLQESKRAGDRPLIKKIVTLKTQMMSHRGVPADMRDPKFAAAALVAAGKRENIEKSVALTMSQINKADHEDVIMAFFHAWRNVPPSLRTSDGVDMVRRILERDYPQHWKFLGR